MTSMRTRERLVSRLRDEGITDENVLDAIRSVPRHIFVDEALASRAYEDVALPIGMGQTISQPFIVALMTQATIAAPTPSNVLENRNRMRIPDRSARLPRHARVHRRTDRLAAHAGADAVA